MSIFWANSIVSKFSYGQTLLSLHNNFAVNDEIAQRYNLSNFILLTFTFTILINKPLQQHKFPE
ncbi:hypothetical protein BEI67_12625 [Photobacterium damselae subsp. piscicida]|nr:hypothetical protein BEI67_12625 [Photobacterium damselae subsp. piscicida]PSV58606.1 hypothetical protein CTT35_15660 [Photobacterium damselae]PSW76045.1 hypothetical protein CTT37_16250 [Photobacterium damselae]